MAKPNSTRRKSKKAKSPTTSSCQLSGNLYIAVLSQVTSTTYPKPTFLPSKYYLRVSALCLAFCIVLFGILFYWCFTSCFARAPSHCTLNHCFSCVGPAHALMMPLAHCPLLEWLCITATLNLLYSVEPRPCLHIGRISTIEHTPLLPKTTASTLPFVEMVDRHLSKVQWRSPPKAVILIDQP